MSLVTVPSYGSDPATVNAANLDGKVSPLLNDYNGNIQNVNIASAAGIVYSKLTLTDSVVNADINSAAAIVDTKLATLSTTGKVNVTALVVGSQATGDILYASSATVFSRLAVGTSSQVLIGGTTPSWGAVPVAAQSDQETATSIVLSVTPGRQQFHPSASKAWCYFNGSTTGTNAPTAGYNVTSVTRNGTGDYTINFTTAFSSSNYVAVGGSNDVSGTIFYTVITLTKSTGTLRITCRQTDNQALHDSTDVNVICFGDQ